MAAIPFGVRAIAAKPVDLRILGLVRRLRSLSCFQIMTTSALSRPNLRILALPDRVLTRSFM